MREASVDHAIPKRWRAIVTEQAARSASLAMGVFDERGTVVAANRGMQLLLEGDGGIDAPVEALRNPTVAALLASEPADAPVFEGVLTFGDGRRVNRSIRGLAWRSRSEVLVVGEFDVAELERFNRETTELLQENLHLQRLVQSREKALLRANQELTVLNEERNRITGIAAHDLRNPLSVVQGMSKLLLSGMIGELEGEQASMIERIEASSVFMLRLVNDLLDLSRIEAGALELELRPTDLAELVGNNVVLNRMLAEQRGITLDLAADAGMPRALVDRGKLEQVLNNLVSNALKYSESGTCVSVAVGFDAEGFTLAVADQGQGIPADERDRLFEPFSTTSVQAAVGEKCTGLGLAIVRRIVDGHGGSIAVDSEVGVGSTFTVRLPPAGEP